MALVSKNYTFSSGAVILASEHNSNFDTIYNDYNGNITNANVASGANIALSKLSLSDDATFTGDITFSNSATTDDVFTITANSLTSGDAIHISSSSSDTSGRSLIFLTSTSTAATGVVGITVNSAAGSHMRFTGDTSNGSPTDGDLWYTGSALNFRDGTSTVDLLTVAKIVQKVGASNSAVVTCDGQIPIDDSVPANTEGDEVVSVAITPTSSTNKLLVRGSAGGKLSSAGGSALVMTIVKDDTVVAAKIADGAETNSQPLGGMIEYYADAGTTDEVTFALNVGCDIASRTIYINGDASGNRVFGGVSSATITVEEIAT